MNQKEHKLISMVMLLFFTVIPYCQLSGQSKIITRGNTYRQKSSKVRSTKANDAHGREYNRKTKIKTSSSYFGTLTVTSNPSDAYVIIDGDPLGFTPFMTHKLLAGKHHRKIKKDGYSPYNKIVDIKRGRNTALRVDLECDDVAVIINANMPITGVEIDNQYYSNFTNNFSRTFSTIISSGRHIVKVISANCYDYIGEINAQHDGDVFSVNLIHK